jgi:phenylacetate-CoA ligase
MPSLAEKIYLRSPVWMQQFLTAVYGYWWYKRRFSEDFHRFVDDFKNRDFWTAGQFKSFQEKELGRLLDAARKSPYYSKLFFEAGISLESSPFECLSQLPLLTKETLRTCGPELLTENPIPKGTIVLKSSGTTGTPTEICYTPEFHALQMAISEARNLIWAGVDYRDRRVMFGAKKVCAFDQARPPFWRYSPFENMAYASIYHLSPEFLPSYLKFLRSFQPAVVMGYPNALYTLARYSLDTGDMPSPAKVVITTSETVLDSARQAIESAWKCPVFDRYGAVEGCVFASQCEEGRYHVSPDIGIVEILDPQGRPVEPGVTGEIVCTGLQNTLQPLIRYRIGDAAMWATNQICRCGRKTPVLEKIEGRFEDICYSPDGRQISRFTSVFKGMHHIREAQVVQENLRLFLVFVVADPEFGSADVEAIQRNMRLHVGNVEVKVESVPSIRRSSSGKFRPVICRLSNEEKALVRGKKHSAGML